MCKYSNKGGNPFILSPNSIGWNLLFHSSVKELLIWIKEKKYAAGYRDW